MKKRHVMVFVAIFVMGIASTSMASAHNRHQDWSRANFDKGRWKETHRVSNDSLPFKWHDRRANLSSRFDHMDRIHDKRMTKAFPGLKAYQWRDTHGNGFWHNGKHVKNAVLFYNDSDELVSVGFMRGGSFVVVRDDYRTYESNDDYFDTWIKMMLISKIIAN